MQFTLQTLLLSFVLVWSALAAFGIPGIWVAVFLLALVACLRSARSKQGIVWILFLFLLFLGVVALLSPGIVVSHESANRAQCQNNLKQIALALHNYREHYGVFAPAYLADEEGKPMHSWRVLILPFLEQQPLYDQYDFSQPWDSPKNKSLASPGRPLYYACPSDPGADAGMTSYLAVVGPAAAWAGSTSRKLDDLSRSGGTILLVELANSGIHWMEPRDLSVEEVLSRIRQPGKDGLPGAHVWDPGYFYRDVRGSYVAMADGSVEFVPVDTPAAIWEGLLRINGKGEVDLPIPDAKRLDWAPIVAVTTLVASFLLLLLRPRRLEPTRKSSESPPA